MFLPIIRKNEGTLPGNMNPCQKRNLEMHSPQRGKTGDGFGPLGMIGLKPRMEGTPQAPHSTTKKGKSK